MSRLTTLPTGWNPAPAGLADVRLRDMGGWWLATNDAGQFAMLEEADCRRFVEGRLDPAGELWKELAEKGFVRESQDFPALARRYRQRNSFLWQPGPSLHMIVVTLRCNQKCHYCHSSVVDPSRTDTDMDLSTARSVVDFIFSTPNPTLAIEFQGGEPQLNWPVVKFVTRYARRRAELEKGRRLLVSLVSNFTLLDDDRLDFLLDNYVSICTSLDGPAEVHDRNRPMLGGGAAQARVVAWLRKVQARCREKEDRRYYLPGALMTTTRHSFPHARQIVDLYAELGMEQVFIRPLSPIGYAKRVWHEIGYSPAEYLEFYERALDRVLELNRQGVPMMERMAVIVLTKVLKGLDPGFMDLRSPAGAVLGCLAYNYDGGIFVSDEGRMVDHQGDPTFRVGDAAASRWADVVDHPTARACALASLLENQPMCEQCAYKPYCGVCPVYHYETQRNLFGQMPSSDWCRGHMGVFDILFRKLRDPDTRRIFESWMRRDQCRWQESESQAPPTGERAGVEGG